MFGPLMGPYLKKMKRHAFLPFGTACRFSGGKTYSIIAFSYKTHRNEFLVFGSVEMNPQIDKVVRTTTVVATAVVTYFLLTADYGPEPNALDPIKRRIISVQDSVKEFIFPSKKSDK